MKQFPYLVEIRFDGDVKCLTAATEEFFDGSLFEFWSNTTTFPDRRMDLSFLRRFEVAGVKYEHNFKITGVLTRRGEVSLVLLRMDSEQQFDYYKQLLTDYQNFLMKVSVG